MDKKVIIYTFIVGDYDTPKEPKGLPDKFAWKCIRPSQSDIKSIGISDPKMASVYYKLHPEILFPDYEWSLCMDANISIEDDRFYSIIERLIESDSVYAGIRHPQRDDIFEESWRIIRNGRDTLANMFRVTSFLKKEGMPRHFGMDETNMILRKHSDPEIAAFDDLWWKMYCKYPRRDQMTHSYCIWKSGISPVSLLPDGQNARNCPLLGYEVHGTDATSKDKSLKGRYRDGVRALQKLIFKTYLILIDRPVTTD